MSDDERKGEGWWARGLLFENCRCQIVCPGHVHFNQLCTYDPCLGHWTIRIDAGEYDGVSLAGLKAVILFESPQRMIDGGWTQVIIIDEEASPPQRDALSTILSGDAGGPWAKLAQFVGENLETRFLPIRITDEGMKKSVSIEGLLKGTVEAIRGRDRSKTVNLENMFNQIHAPSQVIARGDTHYDDGVIVMANEGSHGLYSNFDWSA